MNVSATRKWGAGYFEDSVFEQYIIWFVCEMKYPIINVKEHWFLNVCILSECNLSNRKPISLLRITCYTNAYCILFCIILFGQTQSIFMWDLKFSLQTKSISQYPAMCNVPFSRQVSTDARPGPPVFHVPPKCWHPTTKITHHIPKTKILILYSVSSKLCFSVGTKSFLWPYH
jgi:hypothetical protein